MISLTEKGNLNMPYTHAGLAKALEWIYGELANDPKIDIKRKLELIESASKNFNLTPRDGEYLHHSLKVNVVRKKN